MPDDYNYGENIPYEIVPESKDQDYKRSVWGAAMGLQAVDGLKPSAYLKELAEQNITGRKTYAQINNDLNREYGSIKTRQQEADVVSCRIAQLIEQAAFIMSSDLLLSIHDFLFEGVFDPSIVGKFRKYNIRKSEPILFGDSVNYSDYLSIKANLNSIIEAEKEYTYSKPMTEADITHLSEFTQRIWQVHPFGEGNTRTTAVFVEMYLSSLGCDINNDPFKDNSEFYRNALIRSCYSSDTYDVIPTFKFLEHFYNNLLCGAECVLDSYDLFISNKEDINYIVDSPEPSDGTEGVLFMPDDYNYGENIPFGII